MDGGPSQVDTFDPKPLLTKYDGKDPHSVFTVEPTQFNNVGKVLGSPWKFKQHGQSGLWVSELFPHVAACADESGRHPLDGVELLRAYQRQLLPAHRLRLAGPAQLGAWASYGLGSGNKNLPGFIVLNGGLIPPGGLDNFNSGFLPAAFQGSIFRAGNPPVANIDRREASDALQRGKLDLLNRLDRGQAGRAWARPTRSSRPSPTTRRPTGCRRRCRS